MRRKGRPDEAGFTLPELLVTVSIMSIIGAALTGAVFLGFRTTDATGARVARSSAVQALTAYFTEDVQRAESVGTTLTAEPSGPNECATAPAGRLVRLAWTEDNVPHAVVYALDPPTGTAQEVVRWSCRGNVAVSRVIGHLVHDVGSPLPLEVRCDGGPCPDVPGTPATVTLRIYTDPSASPAAPVEFTVRRRTA